MREVSAVEVLRAWLDREGGNQRIPQVLDVLAERTAADLEKGHSSPALDAESLRKLHADKHGGRVTDSPATRWLSSSDVRRWWEQRQGRIARACREAGLATAPTLSLQPGGGRGNTTQYRLDVLPLPVDGEAAVGTNLLDDFSQEPPGVICYQSEPAKPTWWLRLIIGTAPFRMRSWRGYLLMGMVIAEGLVLLVLWGLILLIMNRPRPITTGDLAMLAVASLITWGWWRLQQPIVRLPVDRVTIAPDYFLAWSQYHGQFRLVRDAQSKVAGGWFQLVRHSGYCPVCSGEVEISAGGEAFPGRLVGCCGDSPFEHVFSFDPVSLTGANLRDGHG